MSIFSTLMGLWNRPPPLEEAERRAIEHAVVVVDPLLKSVSGYQRQLAGAVRHALAYCDGLVTGIPGPIQIDAHAFAADPLVHALFATADDIGAMLGRSRAVREFLAEPAGALAGAGEFHALLGMRRREKNVMGMSLHGEIVRADTPQKLLYFFDHTLRELSADLDETRRRLRQAAFDSLALGFAAQLTEMRSERQQLHNEWDMQRARLPRKPGASSVTADAHGQDRERLEALEERLRLATEALAPERVLNCLSGCLAVPELHLHLDPTTASVDRMGILCNTSSHDPLDSQVSTLNLSELIGRDRRHWIVLIVRISREEALRAVERQQEANRYLII